MECEVDRLLDVDVKTTAEGDGEGVLLAVAMVLARLPDGHEYEAETLPVVEGDEL